MFSEPVRSTLLFYAETRISHGGIDYHTAGFLLSLIESARPRNIVEIGVASGASTCMMLKFFEAIGHHTALSSFDLAQTVYNHPDKPIGHLVHKTYPDGAPGWQLNLGTMSSDVATLIDGKADFVFIDANHNHPWPALDTLMALGFAKPGSFIQHHDINLPRIKPELDSWGAVHLYDDWPGEKRCYPTDSIATSGAIVLYPTVAKNAKILMDIIEAHPAQVKIREDVARKLEVAAEKFLSPKPLDRFRKILGKLQQ